MRTYKKHFLAAIHVFRATKHLNWSRRLGATHEQELSRAKKWLERKEKEENELALSHIREGKEG